MAMTTRKTRIVCISDTHNNTPKLPAGDVLIHAGDLTNQGSYGELERTVAWLERVEFEVKIVVAGNHDITLDEKFYEEKGARWKWPAPQSPRGCAKLLREARTITYLENEATTVHLKSPTGPHTRFRVFGSPYSPGPGDWAFEYQGCEAEGLWAGIPDDADVVVTHTPPKGYCDAAMKDDRTGCDALLRRLADVKPLLHVCGHIHEARGVQRVRWGPASGDSLVDGVEYWQDPGRGNKKLSLLDLTGKSGRFLGNRAKQTRQSACDSLQIGVENQRGISMRGTGLVQPGLDNLNPTSSPIEVALQESEAGDGGAVEQRRSIEPPGAALPGDSGRGPRSHGSGGYEHTAVINAAFLGPRIKGKTSGTSKPIVVDMDLPVWKVDDEHVR